MKQQQRIHLQYKEFCKWHVFIIAIVLLIVINSNSYAADKKKDVGVESELRLKAGEENKNDIKSLKTELLVASSEAKAMSQLQILLKKYKGTAMEPDLWLRMAELYMRQAKTARFFELSRETDTIVKLAPEQVKSASAKKVILKAIDTYELIQNNFPKYGSLDLVYYNNAFSRQQINDNKGAKVLYQKLLKDFSSSNLIPDSYLALGEMFYTEKNFDEAKKYFEVIKKYPDSRIYPYGIYKLAWTQYNLHNNEEALAELEQVVSIAKTRAGTSLSRFDLRQEALGDMVLFFSEVNSAKYALKYFRKQAGDEEAGNYLLKLAKLYDRHSRYEDERMILIDVLDDLPLITERPQIYLQLVDVYETQKNRTQAVKELQHLAELCKSDSKWYKSQNSEKLNLMESCRNPLLSLSLGLASKWHKAWKDNQQHVEAQSIGEAAESAYQIFLANEDPTLVRPDARYAYAELLFQRNKFQIASEQYYLVSMQSKEAKQIHDASYAAIFSFEKYTTDNLSSEQEQRFQVLAANYLQKNPSGEYVLDLNFKLAFLDYKNKRYEKAAPQLKMIGEKFALTEKGQKAQDLYLDILNFNKNYAELKKYSFALLQNQKLSDVRRAELSNIYEESTLTELQLREKNGDKGLYKDYHEFVNSFPNSRFADQAWWKGIQLMLLESKVLAATQASYEMAVRFPTSKYTKDALLSAAHQYEWMGKLKESAKVLEEVAKFDAENKTKWLTTAGDFYALSGDMTTARAMYDKILSLTSDIKLQVAIWTKIEDLESKQSNSQSYEKLIISLSKMNLNPISQKAKVILLEKSFAQKDYSKAFAMAAEVLAPSQQTPPALKARARFVQAQILEDEFRRQSVKAKVDRLGLVLGIKTEKLEKAQKAFQEVILYADPQYSVYSLEHLSQVYGEFANSVRSVSKQTDIKESDRKVLQQEMEKLAIPMEEKQVDTMVQALQQAKKVGLRDGTIGRLQNQINVLNKKAEVIQKLKFTLPSVILPVIVEEL